MESSLPRVTIVTPSFNQAQFLERTIRSVLDQEYPDLEYIVMDGGSTDGSVEIIRRYAEQLTYWTSGPDGGQAAAINAGWRMAHGQVLAWLNSDDFFMPGALSAVGHAFQEHPKAVLVYGQTQLVDPDGLLLGTVGSAYRHRTLMYSHQLIPQPSAFFRRSAVDAVGLLDESLHYSMDLDLFLRLARIAPPLMLQETLAEAKTTRDRSIAAGETHRVRLRYAQGVGALLVRVQPGLSWVFSRMPDWMRRTVNRVRPRRIYQDGGGAPQPTEQPRL
jgi:glycosyltransferase involved in cell wall biosynthesis